MKMILADDEPVITSGIQKLVDWKSLGIEVAGVFEDGKSALDGIVRIKPELALLDISMPGINGIEILKECQGMKLPTKIIFISGFQEFEYARDAIRYGAVGYLLKPVIREELLKAVEECVRFFRKETVEMEAEETREQQPDYTRLVEVEDCWYTPVYAELALDEEVSPQMEKLIRFSFTSFLEDYLEEQKLGITFLKDGKTAIVLKRRGQEDSYAAVEQLRQKAMELTGQNAVFMIGRSVHTMREIPEAFLDCVQMQGYVYFASMLSSSVLSTERPVFHGMFTRERFEETQQMLLEAATETDELYFDKLFEQYGRQVCQLADGKKEDACFYLCTAIHHLEERQGKLGLHKKGMDSAGILEEMRNCVSYHQLLEMTHTIFTEYRVQAKEELGSSEKQNFIRAKQYIEQHYKEELTLNILADIVHMNPFYFSTFFKKNANENFKDYVSRVRVEHAVPLLLSTDKKTYEIAVETGFTDARNFTEVFRRYYNETPNGYRKRMKG